MLAGPISNRTGVFMNRRIIIKRKRRSRTFTIQRFRPRYRLADLLADSGDLPILEAWDRAPAVGLEVVGL